MWTLDISFLSIFKQIVDLYSSNLSFPTFSTRLNFYNELCTLIQNLGIVIHKGVIVLHMDKSTGYLKEIYTALCDRSNWYVKYNMCISFISLHLKF